MTPNNWLKIIGLTGNSGSGKSYVANQLKEQGAFVLDADALARYIVEQGKPAYNEIVSCFGENVLDENKNINRKALAEIVFTNVEKRLKLEEITHKQVLKEMFLQIESISHENTTYKYIVIDAPLLIEAGIHKFCNEVWITYASEEVRLQRVIRRDGISRQHAVKRFESQTPFDELKKHAHLIIETDI